MQLYLAWTLSPSEAQIDRRCSFILKHNRVYKRKLGMVDMLKLTFTWWISRLNRVNVGSLFGLRNCRAKINALLVDAIFRFQSSAFQIFQSLIFVLLVWVLFVFLLSIIISIILILLVFLFSFFPSNCYPETLCVQSKLYWNA